MPATTPPSKLLRPLAAAAAFTALLAGCNEFDQQGNIEDLRIIAARTEPAEIMYSALYLFIPPEDRSPFFPLPEYEVDVEVLAFDPRGGEFTSTMQFCPANRGSCLDYDPEEDVLARFDDDTEERRNEVRAVYLPTERQPGQVDRDVDPSGRLTDTRYTYHFTQAVMDSILRDANGNANITPFSIFPRWVYDVENKAGGEIPWEHAYKRMPLTLDLADPTLPPDVQELLLGILGIELCGELPPYEEWEEGRTGCFYSRPPNSNPAFIGFNIIDLDAEADLLEDALTPEDVDAIKPPIFYDTRADLSPNSVVRIDVGARLALRPVFLPQAREQYQIYSFDIDDSEITIENRFEDFVIKWYKTHGSLPEQTQFQFRQTLDATFTAPNQATVDEIRAARGLREGEPVRDTIIAVIHDQRGGVEFASVIVEYREGQ